MLKENIEYKRFVWEFLTIIRSYEKYRNIVFLCIGTNKIIGDSIGPIVGTNLKNKLLPSNKINVIGDMKNNIVYNNIENTVKNINEKDLVIVIDSALSEDENIGQIFVHNRGVKYAESLNRKNSVIGDMSIKVVVGKNTKNEMKNFNILRNTSISRIVKLSNIVSNGIIEAISIVE